MSISYVDRMEARARLQAKYESWTAGRVYRLGYLSRWGLKLRLMTRRQAGEELACLIAKARKEGPYSETWFLLPNMNFGVTALGKNHPTLIRRINEVQDQEGSGWKRVCWTSRTWFKPKPWHYVHQSTQDPNQIAYYPTIRHLIEGREVRTRPGRYLQQHFADVLSEKDIRNEANAQAFYAAPVQLNFVDNDDPDGWEWVYEHGHGFTSCMVYNRDSRYLSGGLCRENHPVRIYARPGNGLRLAWLGNGYKQEGGIVTARAIVRDYDDGTPQGYIRMYGDDSTLYAALEQAGYSNSTNLYGVELNRHEVGWQIVCPYLDSGNITIHDDYLEVTSSGVDTSSDGFLCSGRHCAHCDNYTDEDHLVSVGPDDEETVCQGCAERFYTWVIGRRGDRYYIHSDYAVRVGLNDYDENYLGDNGIIECCVCGEYVSEDYMGVTQEGDCCEDCRIVLDFEDDEGNQYAPSVKTCEDPNGDVFRTDEGEDDAVTGEVWHKSVMVRVGTEYIHPDTLTASPEAFSVTGTEDGWLLVIGNYGVPLRERDWSEIRFANVEGDISDQLAELAPESAPIMPTPSGSHTGTAEAVHL